MHRMAREERLRGKKLRGKRRRRGAGREKSPGQGFQVDVADERFTALLEGDTRFGIDYTDSSSKVRCVMLVLVLPLRLPSGKVQSLEIILMFVANIPHTHVFCENV